MKISIISKAGLFPSFLADCLKEDEEHTVDINDKCSNDYDVIIFNCLQNNFNVEELQNVSNIKRTIFLENARDIYLNSKCKRPYSVFTRLEPKNIICKKMIETEKFILDYFYEPTIFRISEIYGPSIDFGNIYKLLTEKKIHINSGHCDFIYVADVINAIEITLKEYAVSGIFDLCFGKTISIKHNVISAIQNYRKEKLSISFDKRINFECDADSFKHFHWKPTVDFNVGLKSTASEFIFNRGVT
jgi:nucleoside-diphosphate-sugar epimerase